VRETTDAPPTVGFGRRRLSRERVPVGTAKQPSIVTFYTQRVAGVVGVTTHRFRAGSTPPRRFGRSHAFQPRSDGCPLDTIAAVFRIATCGIRD